MFKNIFQKLTNSDKTKACFCEKRLDDQASLCVCLNQSSDFADLLAGAKQREFDDTHTVAEDEFYEKNESLRKPGI